MGNNKCQDSLLDQTSPVLNSTSRIKRGLTVDGHIVRAFARMFRAIRNEKTFYHFCSDFISVTRSPKHVIRDELAGGTKGEKNEPAHGLDSVDGLDKQDGTSGEGSGARSAVGAPSLIELDPKRATNAVYFEEQVDTKMDTPRRSNVNLRKCNVNLAVFCCKSLTKFIVSHLSGTRLTGPFQLCRSTSL